MKYIMFEVAGGMKVPVAFSKMLRHDVVAAYLKRPINDAFDDDDCKPVSAGFYDPKTGTTFGVSESLKLESKPEDAAEMKSSFH